MLKFDLEPSLIRRSRSRDSRNPFTLKVTNTASWWLCSPQGITPTNNIHLYPLLTCHSACVGQIPHALIIQKVAPRFWLPFTLLVWSGLTMCCAACKTYEQLCVVRFFQGFFESSLYSGTIYILGSWYKPLEIAKRTAIFTAIGQIGSMFAGVMMTAMNEGLNDQTALAGWQWVFLISMSESVVITSFADN
jgi:sugar phosphate permease